jgi:hypothetical protein
MLPGTAESCGRMCCLPSAFEHSTCCLQSDSVRKAAGRQACRWALSTAVQAETVSVQVQAETVTVQVQAEKVSVQVRMTVSMLLQQDTGAVCCIGMQQQQQQQQHTAIVWTEDSFR